MNDEKVPIYANFRRQNKWLGVIEYRTIVMILIYIIGVFFILKWIPLNFEFKIYIFSVLVIPIVFVLFVNINNENVLDIMINIINFILKSKIYVEIDNVVNDDKNMMCKYLKENNEM